MPIHSEITTLRKNGDLEGARQLALEALQRAPHDLFIQGAYGWVLYEELKRVVESFNNGNLNIERLIHSLNHVAGEYRRMDALQRPDLLHSLLFQQMVKVSDEWPGFVSFARWWGFGNFRGEDRQPFQPSDGGRTVPSLEMRAIYAVGKALTRGRVDEEDAEWGISTFDVALQAHPDDVWLNYYKAKSLVSCNRGHDALRFVLPVVMRNLRAGWIWGLLGQIIEPEDSEKAIICYYRAVNVAGQPSEALNTRVRLARLLAQAERFPEAARQVRKAKNDREDAHYRINQDLAELLDAAWFRLQDPTIEAKEPDMEGPALEILSNLFPEGFDRKTGVLESHNKAKELAYVSFSPHEGMPLHYRFHKGVKRLLPGTLVDLSLFTGDGRPRVVSVRVSNKTELSGFMKQVNGIFNIREGQTFGFVTNGGGERVFVAPDLVTHLSLANGATVTGTSVKAVDKKTGKEGWKLISVSQ